MRNLGEFYTDKEFSQLLQVIVDLALQVVPSADSCVIHLLDSDDEKLEERAGSYPPSACGWVAQVLIDAGIAKQVLDQGEALSIGSTASSPELATLFSDAELHSLLVMPLQVDDTLLGTLTLGSSKPTTFARVDSQRIDALAAQISMVVHHANRLLAASRRLEYGDAILEGIPEGLVVLDGENRIAHVNAALCDMFHVLTQERELLPCAIEDCPCSELQRVLDPSAGSIVGPYEVELRTDSEAKTILRVTPSPLSIPGAGAVLIVHDVSSERVALEARALFISQVSHELRAPLQHIIGFVSLLNDVEDLGEAERRRFLDHIEDETYHLARLINDLAELSSIETGRFSVYVERVRLDEFLSDIMEKLRPSAELKDIALLFENVPEPTWIDTDPLRAEQVLVNLVDNARKFVSPGGTITVSAERTRHDVIIRVADTGPGISPDALKRIFAPFYQVKSSGQRGAGMGLGLYISREIIQALGGRIWVESELGVGSTFSVRLPRFRD